MTRRVPTSMGWTAPTLLERHGETIAALLGAVVFGFALGLLTMCAVIS